MLDTLTLLIAGAILCAYLAGALGPRLRVGPSRRRPNGPTKFGSEARRPPKSDGPVIDASDQLRVVMNASFEKRKLLSKDEARVFYRAEKAVETLGLNWRVMAQVCLGEILKSPDARAFGAINSKRVDVLLIASNGDPIAALEYQGSGHYLGTAAARDAVKREALRRAGIAFIEVTPNHDADDMMRELRRLATPSLKAVA